MIVVKNNDEKRTNEQMLMDELEVEKAKNENLRNILSEIDSVLIEMRKMIDEAIENNQ